MQKAFGALHKQQWSYQGIKLQTTGERMKKKNVIPLNLTLIGAEQLRRASVWVRRMKGFSKEIVVPCQRGSAIRKFGIKKVH